MRSIVSRRLLDRPRVVLATATFAVAIAHASMTAHHVEGEGERLLVAETGSTRPERSADEVIDELLRGEATPHTRGLDPPPVAPVEHPAKPPKHRRPVNPPDVGGTRHGDGVDQGDEDH